MVTVNEMFPTLRSVVDESVDQYGKMSRGDNLMLHGRKTIIHILQETTGEKEKYNYSKFRMHISTQ